VPGKLWEDALDIMHAFLREWRDRHELAGFIAWERRDVFNGARACA
jgi:hypothetical protein